MVYTTVGDREEVSKTCNLKDVAALMRACDVTQDGGRLGFGQIRSY